MRQSLLKSCLWDWDPGIKNSGISGLAKCTGIAISIPEQMQEPHPTFDAITVREMLVPTSIGSRLIVAATAPWLWLVGKSWWLGIAPWDWELGGERITGISVTGLIRSLIKRRQSRHARQARQARTTGYSSSRAGNAWTDSEAFGGHSQHQLTLGFRCSCFMLMQYEYLQEWKQVIYIILLCLIFTRCSSNFTHLVSQEALDLNFCQ